MGIVFNKSKRKQTKKRKHVKLHVNNNRGSDASLLTIKLLLLGDSCVGKSSLLLQYADNVFQPTFISTIGVDFKCKQLQYGKQMVRLQLWDTAGQERFRTITSSYYNGAHGIVVVYDVTDKGSFDNVRKWIQEISRYARSEVKVTLIGNKSDLELERVVSYEDGAELAEEFGMMFYETSAKSSANVSEAFEGLTKSVYTQMVD